MRVGKSFPEGGFLPNQYSPVDLFDDDFKETKVHQVRMKIRSSGENDDEDDVLQSVCSLGRFRRFWVGIWVWLGESF